MRILRLLVPATRHLPLQQPLMRAFLSLAAGTLLMAVIGISLSFMV